VAQSFGGAYGKGPRWVVSGDAVAPVQAAVDKLGGDLA
jgi:hypothetical protein